MPHGCRAGSIERLVCKIAERYKREIPGSRLVKLAEKKNRTGLVSWTVKVEKTSRVRRVLFFLSFSFLFFLSDSSDSEAHDSPRQEPSDATEDSIPTSGLAIVRRP